MCLIWPISHFGVSQFQHTPAYHCRQKARLQLVLRLGKNQADGPALGAQLVQRVMVMVKQRIAISGQQRRPVKALGNRAGLVSGRLAALIGHLEEQQVGELLDLVAVAHAVVAQHVAVVPELLDDGG